MRDHGDPDHRGGGVEIRAALGCKLAAARVEREPDQRRGPGIASGQVAVEHGLQPVGVGGDPRPLLDLEGQLAGG